MWMRVKGGTSLGEALEQARGQGALTQAELAARLQVTRTTVIDMEKARPAALRRLVDAFSVLGFEIVIVPRGSHVLVDERRGDHDEA